MVNYDLRVSMFVVFQCLVCHDPMIYPRRNGMHPQVATRRTRPQLSLIQVNIIHHIIYFVDNIRN